MIETIFEASNAMRMLTELPRGGWLILLVLGFPAGDSRGQTPDVSAVGGGASGGGATEPGAVTGPTPSPAELGYVTEIKPLLAERCYSCHGGLKQEAGLRLDTVAAMLEGGDSGPIVEPGDPSLSLLWERVATDDVSWRMPPEHEAEPFSPEQVERLERWIAAGAVAPEDERPEADPSEHWAFQTIRRPAMPPAGDAGRDEWSRNPIDVFVAREHQAHGLRPRETASPLVLLRRLYLDLIGVPPGPREIDAFLADHSPDRYGRVVERLLADPRHGERWARHWMDIWRYSDWYGLGSQLRNSQKHIWHWRDWIVESLNDDLPYDDIVRLMLAADELAPDDLDRLRAGGYLARNFFLFNRHQWMDETVEHVGKGFLGLTANCAKCHDHKYDPISQADYYRLRAFFEPYHVRTDMVPGEPDLSRDGIPRPFDAVLDAPTYVLVRGDESRPDKSRVLAPGVPQLLDFGEREGDWAIEPVELPETAFRPERRPWVAEAHIRAARERLAAARENRSTAAQELARAERHAETLAAQDERDGMGAAGGEDVAATEPRPGLTFADDFRSLDPDRWRPIGGQWHHQPSRLEQRLDGPQRAALRLIAEAPHDFDMTLRFTVLGGSRWRSVGIGFDCTQDDPTLPAGPDDTAQNVYVSAHEGGPKVQASWHRGGQWNYPAEARQSRSVELDREHVLRLQVRGQLVNASFDGELAVAWRTPLARRPGAIQITTFDALAALHEVTIEPLADDAALRDPGPGDLDPDSVAGAQRAVEQARAALRVTELAAEAAGAELESVRRRADAIRADGETRSLTARRAATAERQATLARQRLAVAEAESALLRAAADQREAAEKQLTTARDALAKAEQEPKEAGEPFATLEGARWTPTRFLHSGRDDPAIEFPQVSTGRRSALADWITDPRNPLAARVAVNHIWNRHFGTPLVPSVFDFGRKGTPPTHPELLDWLASELIESGWSMKHLHRLIVHSATYRMASSIDDAETELRVDPDNRWLWRRSASRLESQAVRDSLLDLAGTLDVTRGGPPIPADKQADSRRRSLYFFHSNNDRNLFLTTFDEALVSECYRRETSIVPQQALAMTNSRLVLDTCGPIADRLTRHLATRQPAAGDAEAGDAEAGDTEAGDAAGDTEADEAFIRMAFAVLLADQPDDSELAACARSLDRWRALPEAGEGEPAVAFARRQLVWVLLNHNDFVTVR